MEMENMSSLIVLFLIELGTPASRNLANLPNWTMAKFASLSSLYRKGLGEMRTAQPTLLALLLLITWTPPRQHVTARL